MTVLDRKKIRVDLAPVRQSASVSNITKNKLELKEQTCSYLHRGFFSNLFFPTINQSELTRLSRLRNNYYSKPYDSIIYLGIFYGRFVGELSNENTNPTYRRKLL
jgi:hypothetical protein